MEGDLAVARIASRQRGIISRAQLLAAGLTPDAIALRLRRGRLHSLHRGVYAVGHPHLAPLAREQAALLACGDGALLSTRTAAALWGFVAPRGGPVDVTVFGRERTVRPGIRAHRARALAPDDSTLRHGLALTGALRTLLDLAEVATLEEVEEAVGKARVARWVTPESLLAYADAATGHHGAGALKAVASQAKAEGFTRSKAERKLLELVRVARLPMPETNVVLFGRERDAVWREQEVVVEVDGWAFHSDRPAFERDKLRDGELAPHGWRTVPVTWGQLTESPYVVVARLSAALAVPMGATRP
ncbi:MAG: type IV toxin-antitoxin system AbiEi family antitoxin domain-containing protein [Thermoleophilaceae bacterium]